ncbi:unnamed protein product [Rhodiola kirilowii]
MDLDYELLREFDRVTGQCNQADKTLNISDNTGCSEEECSMIATPTVGFTEASRSNVTVPILSCENPEMAEQQGGIGPSPFPPRDAVPEKKEKAIPQFVSKIYEIVDDPKTDTVVHWGFFGQSFVVGDETKFCNLILPKYFKHKNFSSFIRQLNTYGFRKIDPDKWEFATKEFQRGKRDLLKYIKRRRTDKKMTIGSGKQDEALQKSLHAQIINLSQEVEVYNSRISAFEEKVQLLELKYKKMACLFSKTIENPGFISEIIQKRAYAEDKHGDQTETPSVQEMAKTLAADDDPKLSSASKHLLAQTPNQTEMQVPISMSLPSCGESSCSPSEPQGSAVEDPLESLNSEWMNENEAFEELASEKGMFYFHELESLITVDESNDDWAMAAYNYMHTQPIDRKPSMT